MVNECIAKIEYNGTLYFFLSEIINGTFGTGQGEECTDKERNRGIYLPIDKQAQLTLQGINSYYGITTKPAGPSPTPVIKKESDEIMLNETGRMEIRTLLKKART